jgi:hypothetical protein
MPMQCGGCPVPEDSSALMALRLGQKTVQARPGEARSGELVTPSSPRSWTMRASRHRLYIQGTVKLESSYTRIFEMSQQSRPQTSWKTAASS